MLMLIPFSFAEDCVGTGEFTKYESNPVIARGSGGSWDDAIISRGIHYFNGTQHFLFYGGGTDTSNRQQVSVGLSTGSSLNSLTKHESNPIIDRSDVGYGSSGSGIYPAGIFKIDNIYYMTLDLVTSDGGDISLGMMNSTNLIDWSDLTVLTGVNTGYDDRARVRINPNNPNELIMIWGRLVSGSYQLAKANASIEDPYTWNVINNNILDDGSYNVHYADFIINSTGGCTLFYSTNRDYLPAIGWNTHYTTSIDCETFSLGDVILDRSSSDWDNAYTTGPYIYQDTDNSLEYMFYQGRSTTNTNVYVGMGLATRGLLCGNETPSVPALHNKFTTSINAKTNSIQQIYITRVNQYYSTTNNIVNWFSIVWGDI